MDVSDRIKLVYSGDDDMMRAIDAHSTRIKADALIVDLSSGSAAQFETEIEGHKFAIQITKA